jgi:hypothetical protein
MTEHKFIRTVKGFGDMGRILILSKDLVEFVDTEVEIIVRNKQ